MKQHYLFIACFFLLTLIILAFFKTGLSSGFKSLRHFNSQKWAGNLDDSIWVIKLNKRAYAERMSNPALTIVSADSALALSKSIGYIPGIAEAHRIIGIGHSYQRNTDLAVKNYLQALNYYGRLKNIPDQGKIHNNLGHLYSGNDYKQALKHFNKALKIAIEVPDDNLLAGTYLNIARLYYRKRDYRTALSYYEKSNKIFVKQNDTTFMIAYYQSTGSAFYKLNNLQEAEKRLTKAVRQAKMHNMPGIIVRANISLASTYIAKEDYSAAENSIKEGIYYSRIVKDVKLEYDFIHRAYELETKRKNYRAALGYLKKTYKRDSLLLAENKSENIGKTSQHYLQEKKLQENQLTIANQKYRETLFMWAITIIIVLILLGFVLGFIGFFYMQRKRRRTEFLIQNKIVGLEQRALQATMNPHFLFNIMTSIQYFINKAETKPANEILTGFAKLMRKHLEICLNNTVRLNEEITYLRLYLSLEKVRFEDKMDYEIMIADDLETDDITIPSMLIQPFIENAIWHGIMPKENGGLIQLKFSNHKGVLFIVITDNGVGITNSQNTKATGHISRGLELIHERISLLNKFSKSPIQIKQHQTGDFGTEVQISIPA